VSQRAGKILLASRNAKKLAELRRILGPELPHLEVLGLDDALNGMPGVLSARWAGRHGEDEANLRLVLAQLGDTPDERLGAAFVCAAALVGPDGETVVAGRMTGRLVREPRGDNGFGYDPIFVADGFELTNGELAPEQKDAISHRGKALRAIAEYLTKTEGDEL